MPNCDPPIQHQTQTYRIDFIHVNAIRLYSTDGKKLLSRFILVHSSKIPIPEALFSWKHQLEVWLQTCFGLVCQVWPIQQENTWLKLEARGACSGPAGFTFWSIFPHSPGLFQPVVSRNIKSNLRGHTNSLCPANTPVLSVTYCFLMFAAGPHRRVAHFTRQPELSPRLLRTHTAAMLDPTHLRDTKYLNTQIKAGLCLHKDYLCPKKVCQNCSLVFA